MTAADFAFCACFVLIVLGALAVVTRRNPVYSAGLLAATFLPLAALYFLLQAPLVGIMQILVYMGAIMVLFVFVVMMITLRPEELAKRTHWPHRALAAVFVAAVALLLLAALGEGAGPANAPEIADRAPLAEAAEVAAREGAPVPGGIERLGRLMFEQYPFQFELVSVLILIALTGTVVLAKRDRQEELSD